MKRCPSCQRTYEDDTQAFCMNDGTPLIPDAPTSGFDPQKTLVATGSLNPTPTAPNYGAGGGGGSGQQSNWSSPGWQPTNPTWTQPGASYASPQKKSKLPWILAVLAVLFIGVIGLGGTAAYFMFRNSSNDNDNTKKQGLGFNLNKNDSESSNSSTSSANTNSGSSNDNTSDGAIPTDQAVIKQQLTALEYTWCAADLKGDRATMDRLLATEFKAVNQDGTTQNKQQYLANMKPDEENRSCTYSDLSLGTSGSYAVLIGINTVRGRSANGPYTVRAKFTDTFIWRDGRWQATDTKSQVLN